MIIGLFRFMWDAFRAVFWYFVGFGAMYLVYKIVEGAIR